MNPELDFLITIAKQAGVMALKLQTEDLQIAYKGRADLVTKADKALEAYLLSEIHGKFPSHSIYAEETGEHSGSLEHRWYVDPIDGTTNYAHGMPFYCISVGYACEGKLTLGVIYCPTLDECFAAEFGQGAWLNGKRIQVSRIEKIEDAMLETGFRQRLFNTPKTNMPNFIRLSGEAQSVRRLGSAALGLAYVAAGRLDGFWEIAVNPWDVAAGVLLVREAGGLAEPLYEGGKLLTGSVDILASNPSLFPELREIFKEEKQKLLL